MNSQFELSINLANLDKSKISQSRVFLMCCLRSLVDIDYHTRCSHILTAIKLCKYNGPEVLNGIYGETRTDETAVLLAGACSMRSGSQAKHTLSIRSHKSLTSVQLIAV